MGVEVLGRLIMVVHLDHQPNTIAVCSFGFLARQNLNYFSY